MTRLRERSAASTKQESNDTYVNGDLKINLGDVRSTYYDIHYRSEPTITEQIHIPTFKPLSRKTNINYKYNLKRASDLDPLETAEENVDDEEYIKRHKKHEQTEKRLKNRDRDVALHRLYLQSIELEKQKNSDRLAEFLQKPPSSPTKGLLQSQSMTNIVYLPKHVKLDPIQIIKEKKLTGIFIPKSNLEIIVDPFEFPSNLDDNFTFNHEIESTDEQLNHTRKVPKLSEKYKSQNHDSPIVSKAGTRVHINPQTDELTESLDSKIESKPSKRSAPRARATTATDISSSKKPLEIRKRTQRISTINSAFGYPIPTIKRLDLDYSDNLWYILNERGIY